VSSTLFNEEQDFSIFLPPSGNQVAQETPQKVAEVIHELELAVYIWWGHL
jgi:hypothetical protein